MSKIKGESSGATVHGVVSELSPVKVSQKNQQCRYFNGKVTDRKTISFKPERHGDMQKSQVDWASVSLINCQIQKATQVEFETVASKW